MNGLFAGMILSALYFLGVLLYTEGYYHRTKRFVVQSSKEIDERGRRRSRIYAFLSTTVQVIAFLVISAAFVFFWGVMIYEAFIKSPLSFFFS